MLHIVPVPRRPSPRHLLSVASAAVLATLIVGLVPTGLGRVVSLGGASLVGDRVAGVSTGLRDDGSDLLATPDSGASVPAGTPSDEPPATLPPLLQRVAERPTPTDPKRLTGYRWPLVHARLTTAFEPVTGATWINDGRSFHDGIDLASFCGDRVLAAHDGVVIAAGRRYDDEIGWLGDLEPYYRYLDRKHLWKALPIVLIVDDGNGYRSVYAHFARLAVHVGDRLRAGQLVGFEGATGHATGCHVHYGLFSPLENARFGVRGAVRKRLHTPPYEIARIDPLLVMPNGEAVRRTRRLTKGDEAPAVVGPDTTTVPMAAAPRNRA